MLKLILMVFRIYSANFICADLICADSIANSIKIELRRIVITKC